MSLSLRLASLVRSRLPRLWAMRVGFGTVTRGCCGAIWRSRCPPSGLDGMLAGTALPPAPSHGHRGAASGSPQSGHAARSPPLLGLREARGQPCPLTVATAAGPPRRGRLRGGAGPPPHPRPLPPQSRRRLDGSGAERVCSRCQPAPSRPEPTRAGSAGGEPPPHALSGGGMGPRGTGGWAGRAGAPAPGRTCLLPLLLCAALRSLRASPGSEGERGRGGRAVGAAPTREGGCPAVRGFRLGGFNFGTFRGKRRGTLPAGRRMPRRGCGWQCRWGRGLPAKGGGGGRGRQRRTGRGQAGTGGWVCTDALARARLAAGVPFLQGDGCVRGGWARTAVPARGLPRQPHRCIGAGGGGAGTGESARGRAPAGPAGARRGRGGSRWGALQALAAVRLLSGLKYTYKRRGSRGGGGV